MSTTTPERERELARFAHYRDGNLPSGRAEGVVLGEDEALHYHAPLTSSGWPHRGDGSLSITSRGIIFTTPKAVRRFSWRDVGYLRLTEDGIQFFSWAVRYRYRVRTPERAYSAAVGALANHNRAAAEARERLRLAEIEARRVEAEALSLLAAGDLPTLELDSVALLDGETPHYFNHAVSIRRLKSGDSRVAGELVITNLGFGFIGARAVEIGWRGVHRVGIRRNEVVFVTREGERVYAVADAARAHATATGALLVYRARRAVELAREQQLAEEGLASRHISAATKREVYERDGGRCRRCRSVSDLQYDHVIPWSLGGSSDASNVQLLCGDCNRKKGNREVW